MNTRKSLDIRPTAFRNLARLIRNRYPGRGIVLFADPTLRFLFQMYWIMGRSFNSQNRVFGLDGGRVFTKPANPAKVEDPRLIIYDAMLEALDDHSGQSSYIVSNGHQTNAVAEALSHSWYGQCDPLVDWEHEPDKPNWTNRITGVSVVHREVNRGHCYKTSFELSVLRKSPYGDDHECLRFHYKYGFIEPGYGLCVTTYSGDGDPLPAFDSEPYLLPLLGQDTEEIATSYWEVLDPENRVSLAVKRIPLDHGDSETCIINRFTEVSD